MTKLSENDIIILAEHISQSLPKNGTEISADMVYGIVANVIRGVGKAINKIDPSFEPSELEACLIAYEMVHGNISPEQVGSISALHELQVKNAELLNGKSK